MEDTVVCFELLTNFRDEDSHCMSIDFSATRTVEINKHFNTKYWLMKSLLRSPQDPWFLNAN